MAGSTRSPGSGKGSWYVPKQLRLKLEPEWQAGVFLGRSWTCDTNYIGLSDGSVTTARALVRVPEARRWDAPKLLAIAGTPMALKTINFDTIEETSDPHRGPAGHRQDGPEDDVHVRRIPITMRDLVA